VSRDGCDRQFADFGLWNFNPHDVAVVEWIQWSSSFSRPVIMVAFFWWWKREWRIGRNVNNLELILELAFV